MRSKRSVIYVLINDGVIISFIAKILIEPLKIFAVFVKNPNPKEEDK